MLDIVNGTIDQLELTPHRKKLSMRLSGGMKRKLCVAIALIGDPKVSRGQTVAIALIALIGDPKVSQDETVAIALIALIGTPDPKVNHIGESQRTNSS